MINWLFLLAAVSLAPQPVPGTEVDRIVQEQMEASHLPGVAVAIVDDGDVSLLKGYGQANLEWDAPVDADTRFQLASATKLFTGIVLIRMVEQDRLSLDQSITDFFTDAPDSWRPITVRMLANHTSGLSEDLGQPAPASVADALAAAMRQPLAYAPGSEARYGFTDFTILRAILEQVGKDDLPGLIAREITTPLKMSATGFAHADDDGMVRSSDVLPRRSGIYGWDGSKQRNSEFFFAPLGYGAGGLYSTARDLGTLFAALDRGEIVSEASMSELTTPAVLPNGTSAGFGIGWTVRSYRGVPVVGHSGGPALADILRTPSLGRTIVVLTNQRNFYPMLAERIADLDLPDRFTAIRDDRPKFTALFRRALEEQDPTALAPESRALEPFSSPIGKALLEGVGPIQSIALRSDSESEAGIERTYSVRFARKTMYWRVTSNREGRLIDLRLTD